MNMKLPYLVDINGGQYSLQLFDEDGLSVLDLDENQKYILQDFKSKLISVKEENNSLKYYEIQIDGRTFKVQILDVVDQQILKMNLKSKKI